MEHAFLEHPKSAPTLHVTLSETGLDVDVTGVEPTDNPIKDVNVTRPDQTTPCLTQQEALAEAPETLDGRFAVPQILGEPQ